MNDPYVIAFWTLFGFVFGIMFRQTKIEVNIKATPGSDVMMNWKDKQGETHTQRISGEEKP